jgi:hypothetical protein
MNRTTEPRYNRTTESLAADIGVKPATIRVRLCRTGSYFGLHPRKLPNGRLLWPEDGPERLMTGAV